MRICLRPCAELDTVSLPLISFQSVLVLFSPSYQGILCFWIFNRIFRNCVYFSSRVCFVMICAAHVQCQWIELKLWVCGPMTVTLRVTLGCWFRFRNHHFTTFNFRVYKFYFCQYFCVTKWWMTRLLRCSVQVMMTSIFNGSRSRWTWISNFI